MSSGLKVKGTLINHYHLTVVEDAETNGSGKITNNCQMFVNATTNEAFKITTGSSSVPGFTNGTNAYLKVNGRSIFSGQGHISLGLQSLIETGSFEIQGYFYGPSSQGSQVHARGSSNKVAGGHLN